MRSKLLRLLAAMMAIFLLLWDISSPVQAAAPKPTPLPAADVGWEETVETPEPTLTPAPTLPPVVSSADIELSAEIGYAGALSYLVPMPLTVAIKNNGKDLSGAVAVNIFRNINEYDRYEYPITLSKDSKKQFVIPLTLQMKQDVFTVELVAGGAVIASTHAVPGRVFQVEALAGVLSNDPSSVSYMNIAAEPDSDFIGETWQCMTLNETTFPDTDELMSAFALLVVDGFDVRTLSDQQKDVLERWISEGGIVFVGGGAQAATTYPYFETYTGIAAGALVQAADIAAPLSAYIKRVTDAISDTVMLTQAQTQAQPLIAGEYPLVYRSEAGKGLIFTATFPLGARPLAQWSGARAYWRNFLTTAAPKEYSARLQRRQDNWDDGYIDFNYMLGRIPVKNHASAVPFLLVFLLYLLIMGLVSYFILRKLDKRTLLWITIPLFAVAGALLVRAMGIRLNFDAPLSASFAHVSIDKDGQADAKTYVGVTSALRDELSITPPEGARMKLGGAYNEDYYSSSSWGNETPAPVQKTLKYRFLMDGTGTVGFPPDSAWTVRTMQLDGILPEMQITGKAWFEEDGLHAEITNLSSQPLTDCTFLTTVGFMNVGDLMPGDTAKALLTEPTEEEAKRMRDSGYKMSGRLISRVYNANYYRGDLYDVIYSAIYPELAEMNTEEERSAFHTNMPSDEMERRSFRREMMYSLANRWSNAVNSNDFMFVGFNDAIGKPEMTLNGQKIDRSGHGAYVDVALNYEPVGPTGLVNYTPGIIECHRANAPENQAPVMTPEKLVRNNYFELSADPAFAFLIPDVGGVNIDSLSVMVESYDVTPLVYLYNNQTGAWEQQKLVLVTLTGEQAAKYINGKGELFVRYTSPDQAVRYAGVNTPALEMKGRVK